MLFLCQRFLQRFTWEGGEDAQPTDLPEHHARVVLDLHAHDDAILAAVLGKDHDVRSWVYGHQVEVSDATFAFARATEV